MRSKLHKRECSWGGAILVGTFCLVAIVGCNRAEYKDKLGGREYVLVDIDKKNVHTLLEYFFYPFLDTTAIDGKEFVIQLSDEKYKVRADDSLWGVPLSEFLSEQVGSDNTITWEEFKAFVEDAYYDRVGIPGSLNDLLNEDLSYRDNSREWFHVEIDGVMTSARRHIYVKNEAIRESIFSFRKNGNKIIYPTGTVILGEHWVDASLIEITAMAKRFDGYWDFFVFDAGGEIVKSTVTPPKRLEVPLQCVGCHTGSKLFEPEKSFPGYAKSGPHGKRAIYVDERLRNKAVTALFDEHRRRGDHVLGIYATLYVSSLLLNKTRDSLNTEDLEVLKIMGL
jgi:hypothetical protein